MRIYSIIPARAGSKGVPGKNIRLLGGYPLIAYSVCASIDTKDIERTIVSTDSKEIADIAQKYGAEVPFLRPEAISRDDSTDLEFVKHAINWLRINEGTVPDLLVHLRPTTPLRDSAEVQRAINKISNHPDSTSLRSVHELSEPPHKVFQINKDDELIGFFPDDPRPEYYNLPRQILPRAYYPNGYVDMIKPNFVEQCDSLHGPKMMAYVTSLTSEVDRIEDLHYLEYQLERYGNPIYKRLTKKFSKEYHGRV